MPFHSRLKRILILLSCFWLTGFELSQCSFLDSGDGDSSRGSAGIGIRVQDEQKISADEGSFNGDLNTGDRFGSAVGSPGDLESDGVQDLAVGAPFTDDEGTDRGAVWFLFMDDTGRVDLEREISGSTGGFGGDLDDDDLFGSALAGTGDVNEDGVSDLAAGAPGDDDGGTDRGAVWTLFLNDAGGVRDEQKLADGAGGFRGDLDDGDRFGSAVAGIGDVNGDGVADLAVGAPGDDSNGSDRGAVWILFLTPGGRVLGEQKLADDAGGFDGDLDDGDRFGSAVAGIGDVNGDGVADLAVGAPGDDSNGSDRGAVWIVFLTPGGRVLDEQKLADGDGGFGGELDDGDRFGSAVAGIGDVNGGGVTGLAVGAPYDDDGSDDAGAVWILFLEDDGRVDAWQKVSRDEGGFGGDLDSGDLFGAALAGIDDLDNNGVVDLAVGAPGDDDGGEDKGAVWTLFMQRTD
jgi:hypothetical protein